MSINLTLIGQMITFIVFIWFTMRYVWPPVQKAMLERQKKIAEGLEDADKAKRELELAKHRSVDIVRDAKLEAAQIVEQSNKRAAQLIEDAKEQARQEGENILTRANSEVDQMILNAKESLRLDVADLAVAGAEKIMQKNVDKSVHDKLLSELVMEL